jgi:hypothetical protein
MEAVIKAVFAAPLATLFIIAGMLFLLIGVVGNISGKIEPGEKARLVSGVMGLLFIALGLGIHLLQKPPSKRSRSRSQKYLSDHSDVA